MPLPPECLADIYEAIYSLSRFFLILLLHFQVDVRSSQAAAAVLPARLILVERTAAGGEIASSVAVESASRVRDWQYIFRGIKKERTFLLVFSFIIFHVWQR